MDPRYRNSVTASTVFPAVVISVAVLPDPKFCIFVFLPDIISADRVSQQSDKIPQEQIAMSLSDQPVVRLGGLCECWMQHFQMPRLKVKVKVNICYSAPSRLSHRRGTQVYGAHKAASHIPALNLPSHSRYSFTAVSYTHLTLPTKRIV